jgi:hypothetical protein
MGTIKSLDFRVGDIVQTKKKHPCGDDRWEILRIGMDFRLRCLGCGRLILVPRVKAEKSIKRIVVKAP